MVSNPIVFVVGSGRSGTSVMARILGRSEQVFQFRELHFYDRLYIGADPDKKLTGREACSIYRKLWVTQLKGIVGTRVLENLDGVQVPADIAANGGTPAEIFARFVQDYISDKKPGAMGCDQTPKYVLYIPEILAQFPEARVINMIRDPRDVIVSQKNKWKPKKNRKWKMPWTERVRLQLNYHAALIARLWKSCITASDRFRDNPRVLTLLFEDLLEEPERRVREVCEFVGIEYRPEMLVVPVVGSSHEAARGRVGLDASRAYAWRKDGGISAVELYLCQKVAGQEMKSCGYDLHESRCSWYSVLWSLLVLLVKLPAVVVTAAGRSKSLPNTINRRVS